MAGTSRMDRLVKVLGGEENLPPKKPQAQASAPSNTNVNPTEDVADPSSNTKTQDGEDSAVEWWNLQPQLHLHEPDPTAPGPATTPTTPHMADGDSHYNFDPRRGEPAPLGMGYCPFAAVVKYPYKFVKADLRQPLATAFFDASKIWNREWDLHYIWSEHYPTAKPVLFIPKYQLQGLLDDINHAFPNAHLKITDELREDGLVISFDDIDLRHLRPVVLGHSTSRDQIDYWTDHLPLPESVSEDMGSRTHEAFRAKMELAQEIAKNKSKAAKKKRQEEVVIKRQGMAREMKRAQKYLGMCPGPQSSESLEADLANLSLSPIDITNIMPYPFGQDVIFIAITEIGIATLDTRDLKTTAPGPTGTEWQKAIRARHIRVAEYTYLVNKDFVQGCPDKFEFGRSEFVGLDKVVQTTASCFKYPYSGSPPPDETEEKRNIVLVGHDISQDIKYLHSIGYNPYNSSSVVDTLDTATMFRVCNKDPNARALGSILYEYDLTGWHLHNAGNDAVYTLWALLAMCVTQSSQRDSDDAAKQMEEKLKQRTVEAIERAKEKVEDDMEGWEEGGVNLDEEKPMYGPKRPGEKVFYTSGGAILDV
ncbi:uncharacterized protein LTR77_002612 [Saxophila tyrrhenica]|uniref:Gfd2/YDR514C-like C-terminal domain-containing protein n=1 Tax=Saxophila tyrrhenica TaxID=1690608 RepID=A0AAV9PL13_9PEZI|nr:hypothetical protein LTR77_002612 [Saxophila tyrrhenica]